MKDDDDDGDREATFDGLVVHAGKAAILSFQSGISSNIGHCLILGGAHTVVEGMDTIKDLKRVKRELKSVTTRSLTCLAIRSAAEKPDCCQITAILERIEEALAVMSNLEAELDKQKKKSGEGKRGSRYLDRAGRSRNSQSSFVIGF